MNVSGSIRHNPSTIDEFVGQPRAKSRLKLAIQASQSRGERPPHILLLGPAGSGKATLARLIAQMVGSPTKCVDGESIGAAAELAGILTNLEENDTLVIRDIHLLKRTIADCLAPAMVDFKLDITIDEGRAARPVRLNLPVFTLIATATRQELVKRSVSSSFRIVESMDPYSLPELTLITRRFTDAFNVAIEDEAAELVARVADGTPLEILRRIWHIADYATVKRAPSPITAQTARDALKLLGLHEASQYLADSREAIPSEVRREVWRRDKGTCVRCGGRERLEYDHIIPVAEGGSNTARNIELLCEDCNRQKSDSIQ